MIERLIKVTGTALVSDTFLRNPLKFLFHKVKKSVVSVTQ